MTEKEPELVLNPPGFCEYVPGPCDQDSRGQKEHTAFFIYPSQPPHLANTIRECLRQLQGHTAPSNWVGWEDLKVGGQIVFCEICKALRYSNVVVANITTLNFNVLFELGYAIGLRKPVLPVRDSSYERDKNLLDEVGFFDTLGYETFDNSIALASLIANSKGVRTPVIHSHYEMNREQPIYYVRAPIETDGSIKIFSCLKKGYFRFRTFDSRETPRLSLHEAYKQVSSSAAVIAHLMDPNRAGAEAHNARAAFVCGLALADGKHVLMLQEGKFSQPIDYRDLVIPYDDATVVPLFIERLLRATAEALQSLSVPRAEVPRRILEKVDIGDVAAENEIQALNRYFVRTPQFQQARQGHARLVIGRKGSGKTALFYGVRKNVGQGKRQLVLDLKPEGHQFTKLRELVLSKLSEGLQQHTLTAFWHYLLLAEIAKKLIDRESGSAWRDQESLVQFEKLKALYDRYVETEGDFSERLMSLVNRLIAVANKAGASALTAPQITATVYSGDIAELSSLVVELQAKHGNLWILFDNIDKGFPSHGLSKEDILIVRCLLEAARKVQRALERHNIECNTIVFIRRDVFDLLIDNTPDRGKESYVNLDWSDTELIKELLLRRLQVSVPELIGSFEEIWATLFDAHVEAENSFLHLLSRTFLRPRDVLNFVRKCIHVAVSREHDRVHEEDILIAEAEYSEDMLNETKYEIRDIYPQYPDVPNAFMNASPRLSKEDIALYLMESGVAEADVDHAIEVLVWFCFLGVRADDEEHYCYQVSYNHEKLMAMIRGAKDADPVYVIHPAFQRALRLKSERR